MQESESSALLEQLRRDAQASAAQTIEAARGEATRVRAEADARLARDRAGAVTAREQAHAAALERLRSDTRTRTARDWLNARAEAIDRVFIAAQASLVERAGEPRFVTAITRSSVDALGYLPPGEAVARCAKSLAAAVRAALESQTSALATVRVVEDDTAATGVVLETADHLLIIDATLARRLVRERPRLAIAVARELEGAAP